MTAASDHATTQRSLRALQVAQALGAFNDNAWKMLLIALVGRTITGTGAEREVAEQQQTMLAMVVFTLPLALLSLPAGALADRCRKNRVLVGAKVLEVVLMATGSALLFADPGATLGPLVILGLMGLQSAIFSPAKYGILPEIVPHGDLSRANGRLELWTFVAIIAGTALGPQILAVAPASPVFTGVVLTALALAGAFASRFIQRTEPARSAGGVAASVRGAAAALRADRTLLLAVLGQTWFWTIASLLGQDLIVYGKTILRLGEAWIGVPLGVFGLGVGLGSELAGRIAKNRVEMGFVPLGAVGLAVLTTLLGVFAPGLLGTCALMLLLGVASGFVVVPLNALQQWRAPESHRGAVIAVSNTFAFLGMLLGSLLGGQLALQGFSCRGILLGASAFTLVGTVFAVWLLPQALVRTLLLLVTTTFYRLAIRGGANVPQQGGVLLAPNHQSFVDGLFLGASTDRPIRFVVDRAQYERPLVGRVLRWMGAIPVSQTGGPRQILRALRDAGQALDQGEIVCIFPEGQITRTGALLPFRRGLERIVKGRAATIVPVHLDRVWGSIFSFAGGRFGTKIPERVPYPVTVTFGPPLPPSTPVAAVREAVADLAARAWLDRRADCTPLHRAFLSRMRRGPLRLCATDRTRGALSRLQVAAGAVAMARALRATWRDQPHVGLLLPPSVAGVIANLAAALAGRVAVNLNHTAGRAGMASAVRQAGLRTVLTSREYVLKAKIELPPGPEPLFLEDLRPRIGTAQRAAAAIVALLAPKRLVERWAGAARPQTADDLLTILFSSGSTGEPKGVMLSHFNLDSNIQALAQVFRPDRRDRLLAILPLFHSFGTMSLWFGLLRGVPLVCHPSPLDAEAIGQLVLDHEVTMLLATPTFLSMYMRRCTPEQFGSLRIVMTGAEKLPQRLADEFEQSFGIRPLEGYGATECAPVIAASIPPFRAPGFFQAGSKRGSVGPLLPCMTARIVDPDTGAPVPPGTPGLLLVRGPNVMCGYLGRDDLTRQAMRDGYYTTGDIARLDADGFLFITDRLARFSKIGGEMVPHGRVEEALHEAAAAKGLAFAVTALPDEKKGERLAVLTTFDLARVPALLEQLAASGLPNLFLPKRDAFARVDAIPVLGTGKVDLQALKRIAKERLGATS
jgi:acyl-[acyl-carrier-protein]-phospholipid O-acyltransferase/long-chain-fatty-acid--[acyl-carrier-protein] ligase